jgi:hypothetical protein
MVMKKSKKPKFGDIIEMPTIKGFAYALYTHDDLRKYYGEMIRVLPGFFSTRPESFDSLVQEGEQFTVFTGIPEACKFKMAEIVANVAIPEWAKARPKIRWEFEIPNDDGSIDFWYILDEHGLECTKVKELTPELLKLPVDGANCILYVIGKKVLGWTNGDDDTTFWKRKPFTQEMFDNIFWCIPKSLYPKDTAPRRSSRKGKPWYKQLSQSFQIFERDPISQADYPERSDFFAGSGMVPGLLEQYHSSNLLSSSDFSDCGEWFFYLKIDGKNGLTGSTFIDRSQIEDALDAALRKSKLGCVVGGGTGLRYAYIDFAILDIFAAFEIIRDLLRDGKIPKRSWILFFDTEKSKEWLGIWEDTPAPPGTKPAS